MKNKEIRGQEKKETEEQDNHEDQKGQTESWGKSHSKMDQVTKRLEFQPNQP